LENSKAKIYKINIYMKADVIGSVNENGGEK